MKIALACDHGGFQKKALIMQYLEEKGYKIMDFGSYTPAPVDYPDYAIPAAESVARGENDRAILVCRTGIGESIAANKVHGVRAALCYNEAVAQTSRTHNNANVLCLAGDYLNDEAALRIVEVWLNGKFRGGRHRRRIDKISSYESLNRRFDRKRSTGLSSAVCPRKRKAPARKTRPR